jgi:site-specific recombinase XerD
MRGGWVENGTVVIKLTRAHFAFYRGYLNGLDIGALARRYLVMDPNSAPAAEDLRLARSCLEWIRRQLVIAAQRASTPTAARLIALRPERLNIQSAAAKPTLEQFREEKDPDGDGYSEAELIELFKEEYGASTGEDRLLERNERLRKKQRDALARLEAAVAADPKLGDRVDGWLDPVLAKRLQDAGIPTLYALVDLINRYGRRWYRTVPRVGETAADLIVAWLREDAVERALGVQIYGPGLTERPRSLSLTTLPVPARFSLAPLELFHAPSELDGSVGTNRAQGPCPLDADNDLAAIHAWLKARCSPDSKHTLRLYRKEAERFLLWSIFEKQKPISSLSVEDCSDFRDFLAMLGQPAAADKDRNWSSRFKLPESTWIGKKGERRGSEFWKPFAGPLTPSSQKTALVLVDSLCQWLTEMHYLHVNPFKGVNDRIKRADRIDTSRALSHAEWDTVKAHLAKMADGDAYNRIRFFLVFAYSTGLRLSEMAALRIENVATIETPEGPRHELTVAGKGKVERKVPVSLGLRNEIEKYLRARGHLSMTAALPSSPLIAALPTRPMENPGEILGGVADDPLTSGRLYDVVKAFFTSVAHGSPDITAESRRRLLRASTHWMRHTFASHGLRAKIDLDVIQAVLGHRSIATTSVYLNTEQEHRAREIEKLSARAAF